MPDIDFTQMTEAEIQHTLRNLSPKAKEEVARRVNARMSAERKLWYCLDRQCNGEAHEGFEYAHARADQQPPAGIDWLIWLISGGRGSGKTRSGSEYTRQVSKKIQWIGLVGPTVPAARDVMIEGESGLLAVCRRAGEPANYEPSKRRVTFASGARAQIFSAEEPDRLRGPQHGFVWADEPAHWPNVEDVWDMIMFGLRLPPRPHILLTTTPKPTEWMREVMADSGTRVSRVSTYANIKNLAEEVARRILSKYEGTRLGRQEIYGEVIDDVDGALWESTMFQYVDEADLPEFDRVVVGIDPAGSAGKKSDLTGIIGAGCRGNDFYALADKSGTYTPSGWANAAIDMYNDLKADAIVVERNYGGDMCRATLVAEGFEGRVIEARATDGKRLRAEPISALYEQGRGYHVKGLQKLEAEQVSWVPGHGRSPNRVDALVWCGTELMKTGSGVMSLGIPKGRQLLTAGAGAMRRGLALPGGIRRQPNGLAGMR